MGAIINKVSLGIRGRLFLGFTLLVVPILIVIIVFLLKINTIKIFAEKLVEVIIPAQQVATMLDTHIFQTELAGYEWLITENPQAKINFDKAWQEIQQAQKQLDQLQSKWTNQGFAKQWNSLKDLYVSLKQVQNKKMLLQLNNNTAEIKQLSLNEEKPIVNKMLAIISGSDDSGEGLREIQSKNLSLDANNILNDMKTLRIMALSLLAITIILAIVVSYFTAKNIINPVNIYRKHSSKVAGGDLTQRISISNMDEMGSLGNDLNIMTESLAKITKKITEASQNMLTALNEVKQASDMQSTGISQQASSINEISASLEEIDKSANQTMEKAKILGQIAEQTSQKGQLGLEAVEQSIDGMKAIHNKVETIAKTILELSNQTQQIGEITAVVNTLALQSKMLALNASIEAAKAGDAGKGFAVVAAEVKNLAEQSEHSTTQVQKILEDIRHGTEKAVLATEEGAKGVAQGTTVVEQMADIVHSLNDAINETMVASQQIEAAIRQESLGIEQITVGMNEINQVTSSFVSTVKQTTQLISELGEMAQSIKEYVDIYKV